MFLNPLIFLAQRFKGLVQINITGYTYKRI